MDTNAPVNQGSKEATFTALAAAFKLDGKITALFLKSPMENLQDFRFYFADEKEIDSFIAADDTLEAQEQKIQTSRMRRAWSAVRRSKLENDDHIVTPPSAELDDLVGEETLRNIKV